MPPRRGRPAGVKNGEGLPRNKMPSRVAGCAFCNGQMGGRAVISCTGKKVVAVYCNDCGLRRDGTKVVVAAKVLIVLPSNLLDRVDEVTDQYFETRSDLVRLALHSFVSRGASKIRMSNAYLH